MATAETELRTTGASPLPPLLPSGRLLGHLAAFRSDAPTLFVRAMGQGDVVRLRVVNRFMTAAFRPEHVQHVLIHRVNHYDKWTRGYVFLRTVLGDGLLTAEGETWKKHRRIANPAFQQARIASFAETFRAEAQALADRWVAAARSGETVEVAEQMNALTLRVACRTLFSLDISEQVGTIGEALSDVLGGFVRSVTNPLLLRLPLPSTRRWYRGVATLDGVVRQIIARRRAEGGEREDLLGLLMAARDSETGEALGDEQLRDEVLTMLAAGHETTANALTWTIYRLSQHPPAWLIARRSLEADTLSGMAVPAGGFVFLSPYAIHRHPSIWSDPELFDPERFLPERAICPDGSPRPKLAYLPFGAGQRKCIGEPFAMLEATIMLGVLAERFRFELKPGWTVRNDASVTLRPKGGMPVRLRL